MCLGHSVPLNVELAFVRTSPVPGPILHLLEAGEEGNQLPKENPNCSVLGQPLLMESSFKGDRNICVWGLFSLHPPPQLSPGE